MYKLGRRQCRGQFFSELGVIVPRGTPDVRLVSVWSVKPLNPRIRYDEWPALLLLAWIVETPDPRTPQGAQGALERTDGKSTQRNGSKSKGSERSRIVGNQSSRRFLGAQGAQESPESKSTQRNGSKSKGSERDPGFIKSQGPGGPGGQSPGVPGEPRKSEMHGFIK